MSGRCHLMQQSCQQLPSSCAFVGLIGICVFRMFKPFVGLHRYPICPRMSFGNPGVIGSIPRGSIAARPLPTGLKVARGHQRVAVAGRRIAVNVRRPRMRRRRPPVVAYY